MHTTIVSFFSYEINVNAFIRYSLLYGYSMNVLISEEYHVFDEPGLLKCQFKTFYCRPLIHNAGPERSSYVKHNQWFT
jgi:hypothetical protein